MKKNRDNFSPWKEYPEIWKTEAKFWAWLRGGLRRGLWEKSPIKISFKNANVSKPPKGLETRAKTGTECSLSGEWTGKSKLEVDHKIGNVSLKAVDDILDFILHLIPSYKDLQLVSKEAHKVKSYAERYGLTYEEALVAKKVIASTKKSTASQIKELTGLGYPASMTSNAKKRRECYEDHYKEK